MSAVNKAAEKAEKVEVRVSFESNNGQLTSSKCLDSNCPF